MKNRKKYFKVICGLFIGIFILTGCANNYSTEKEISEEEEKDEKTEMDSNSISGETNTEDSTEDIVTEPKIVSADWSEYFNGLNGTAVVYDPSDRQYMVYNQELAETRRPPCSTFKIISSLIALENGIITPENSTRTWSGEIFWNEDWNRDIDFSEAFRTSCVWYYRQVIDDIGKEEFIRDYMHINSNDEEEEVEINKRGFFSLTEDQMLKIIEDKVWRCPRCGKIFRIEKDESFKIYLWWAIRCGRHTGPDDCIVEAVPIYKIVEAVGCNEKME